MHGQFIWYELTTPDVDAAKKFYPRFTGWGTQPFDNDYTMWTTGGVPVGGLFQLSDEMRQQGVPPNWMPYVESSNVDDTVAKATSLGGQLLHGPEDIPGAGRIAVLQDPQGAAFGVYKSTTGMSGWDGTASVGRFSWHELMTTDRVAAFEFYRALFGWEKTGEMDMGGGEMYSMYGHGENMYGGMFNATGDMAGMRPFWLVYIHVQDVGKAVAAATKAGAMVHRPQMDIPGGSIAILGDPQGAGFALHHVSAQAPAPEPATKPTAKTVAKAARRVSKKVVKAAKKVTRKVATAAKKAQKTVAKKVKTATKRGTTRATKAAKKAPRKPAKSATRTNTRPKAKAKTARKAASKARPSARKKTKTARKSGATRRR
jgi:uncharacterized protein